MRSKKQFDRVYRLITEVERMELAKPSVYEGNVSSHKFSKSGNLILRNDRFKTRIRKSETASFILFECDLHRI